MSTCRHSCQFKTRIACKDTVDLSNKSTNVVQLLRRVLVDELPPEVRETLVPPMAFPKNAVEQGIFGKLRASPGPSSRQGAVMSAPFIKIKSASSAYKPHQFS